MAIAAGVLVAVTGGLVAAGQLAGRMGGSTASSENAAAGSASRRNGPAVSPAAVTPPAAAVWPAPDHIVTSGRDYTAATLAQAGRDTDQMSGPAAASGGTVRPGLARLTDPGARDACLAAVASRYGGRVVWVDYARFQGDPALILVLVDGGANPARRVVAVGPDCGVPAGSTDTLATTGG